MCTCHSNVWTTRSLHWPAREHSLLGEFQCNATQMSRRQHLRSVTFSVDYTHKHAYIHTYMCMQIHMYTESCAHTYMHTHTHKRPVGLLWDLKPLTQGLLAKEMRDWDSHELWSKCSGTWSGPSFLSHCHVPYGTQQACVTVTRKHRGIYTWTFPLLGQGFSDAREQTMSCMASGLSLERVQGSKPQKVRKKRRMNQGGRLLWLLWPLGLSQQKGGFLFI